MRLVRSATAFVGLWLTAAIPGCSAPAPPAALVRDRALTLWAERWDDGRLAAGSDTLWLGGPGHGQARLRFALPPRTALGRAELTVSPIASWPGSTGALHLAVRVVDSRANLVRIGRRDGRPATVELLPTPQPLLHFVLDTALARAWARRESSVWLRVTLDERDARLPLASPAHPDRGRRPRLVLY